jgi:hypothetical protein
MARRARVGDDFVQQQAQALNELLRLRAAVSRDDLEYLVERVSRLKDERLQAAVAGLIGWGDAERAEIETFVAIAIEVMRHTSVTRLREAARTVELRYLAREMAAKAAQGGDR